MTEQDLHDMYYQDQKIGMVEIFVTLRLPVNMYEAGAALSKMTNHRSFEDYVSDCVVRDLETMSDGAVAEDIVSEKITGKGSPWMENQKKHWKGVIKRLKEQDKIVKKNNCQKCGEWLEGNSVCVECGHGNK